MVKSLGQVGEVLKEKSSVISTQASEHSNLDYRVKHERSETNPNQ